MTYEANVATAKPAAYMKQLCRHFGHKVRSEWTEESGSITFDYGTCELRVAPDTLVLRTHADDAAAAERLRDVIGSHLERFGRRDELSVNWTAAA